MPMLKSPGTVIAEHLNRASILFIVFDDFSQLARKASPSQLFSFLNRSFTKFDKICAAQEVTKVETVGEEYVCGVGISPEDRHKDDILGHKDILGRLLRAAYEIHMLQYLPQRDSMMLKMGIHTGPVVAGVVGQKLPRFRLFGDTMNTAARMMQMGSCHEVQFGESTAKELPEWASARPRGYVEMKGKGEMMTYVLDWSSVEKQFSYRSNAEDSVKVLQGQITPFEARTPSTPGKATLVDSLFEFVHGKPHNEVQELETKSGILEVAKTVSFTDALAGKSWLRKHCNPFALWLEFSIQEETAFTRWFTEERTMKGFARSLRWQLTFFTGLSLSVAIYAIYRMEGFAGTTDCLHSLSLLWPFLACRLFTFLPICCWRIALRLNNSRKSQLCLAFIRSIIGVCIILSYELLPVGLSKGRYASHYGGPSDQDNQPSGFGLHDVASNIIPFVLFAEYSYSISSVQLLFIPTLLSKVLSISLLGPLGFLVFQKGTLLGYLIVASAFSIFRIYFLEESLRRKFKALCMVDLTYQRIHSILATLMPPMVVEDLRLSVTRQSHHYKKATVVQSDLCGFTKLASTRQPSEVVEFIGQLFGLFDDLTEEYDIYKVETVGDAYIAAMAEEPLTSKNKPLSVVLFGLRMIQAAACWSARRGEQIGCRVGVHSGSCLGGIVGTSMQRYHLFGELMTSLEVLESTAPEGRVQLSQACRHCLEVDLTNEGLRSDEFFLFEKRTESLLTTSKGATHEFSEVGGATYLVSPTPQGSSQFGLVSRSASSTFI
jgi:class 3 adenylate cyclase